MMLACWDKDPDRRPGFEMMVPALSGLVTTLTN